MKKQNILKWGKGTVIVLILLSFILSAQSYIRRGIQGRIKSAADDIGYQFSPGNKTVRNAQYSPYYLKSNFKVMDMEESEVNVLFPNRKVIHTGEIHLIVKSAKMLHDQLPHFVNQVGGYITHSDLQNYSKNYFKGITIIRIDPKKFQSSMDSIKDFGKVTLLKTNGEDVTEEFFDLEARIENLENVKQRLIDILKVRTKNIKDILEVEKEISRTSEEIERLKGRKKYLSNQTDLATITINYSEEIPLTKKSFNFVKKLKNSLWESTDIFITIFLGFFGILGFVLPILIWLGLMAGLILFVIKIFFKKKRVK